MKFIGFTKSNSASYKEFLPYSEQLTSDRQQRAIFFHMFNAYMEEDVRFSKQEMASGLSIESCFKRKIISEIDLSCIKPYTPYMGANIKMDISSSLLIYAYFTHKQISFPFKNKPFLAVGKLIELIYAPKGLSLLLDLEDMFLHLVYERIKKVNKHADVLLYENYIVIKDKRAHIADSLVLPHYKKIDKDKLYDDTEFVKQMNTVQETLSRGEIHNIYLVYPKHPNFSKHISIKLPYQIKLSEDEYMVKVMPYSFSFCDKAMRKKSKAVK